MQLTTGDASASDTVNGPQKIRNELALSARTNFASGGVKSGGSKSSKTGADIS